MPHEDTGLGQWPQICIIPASDGALNLLVARHYALETGALVGRPGHFVKQLLHEMAQLGFDLLAALDHLCVAGSL